jgi:hypothetical protein
MHDLHREDIVQRSLSEPSRSRGKAMKRSISRYKKALIESEPFIPVQRRLRSIVDNGEEKKKIKRFLGLAFCYR